MQQLSIRARAFQQAIATFITTRRDEKLKNEAEESPAAAKYDYATWLEDAARRVAQIQGATHAAKATHSSSGGSSLYIRPDDLPKRKEIGSHSLGSYFAVDVVGNAAALDVFKFLKTIVDNKTLLAWAEAGDPDFKAALSPDAQQAQSWITAFAGLVTSRENFSSHALMKQLYWLTGDEPTDDSHYSLLQPLFSSALAHTVHASIQESRFGEQNTLARQAFRKRQPYDQEYQDYKGLVVRKLGGTKPQNVSQLNSEHGGVNYLLSSLPPQWRSQRKPPVFNRDTVMTAFFKGVDAAYVVRKLAGFLKKDPPPTLETREYRQELEQELASALVNFEAGVKDALPAGWSVAPTCHLALCEQLWLDPERAAHDEDFRKAYEWGDWPDEVAQRFANHLNAALRQAGLTAVADTEYTHWIRQVLLSVAWPVPRRRRAERSAGNE